jgi:protocatechuate 3,4-dioxygenase beta subunit
MAAMKAFLIVFVSLIASVSSAAQTTPAAATAEHPPARIEGKTINAIDNTPLRNVEIALMGNDMEGMPRAAKSDAEGHFSFPTVAPGTYRVSIARTGFVPRRSSRATLNNGAMITLAEGEKIVDAVIPLWPAAVIRGKVLDAGGEPVANARVTVLRPSRGKRAPLDMSPGANTDDNGDFRLFGIAPGKYVVMATGNTGMEVALTESESAKESRTVPTYYPSTADFNQATPISLRSGDELPLNIVLTTAKTVHVRGNVSGKPAAMTFVILIGVQEFFLGGRAPVKDGKFDIAGVTPGKYMLQAVSMNEGDSQPRMARQMVEVGPTGADNIVIVLGGHAVVTGSVSSEGGKLDLKKIRLMLFPAETGDFSGGFAFSADDRDSGRVNADGTVHFKNLDPGRYWLRVTANSSGVEDWYTKSIRVGTQDVTYSSIELAPDANVSFQMVLSPDGGTLEGVAVDDKEKPWPNVMVVAVPDATRRQDNESYGNATADQHGRFKMRGLAPGEYTVFAIEDNEAIAELHDPDFLKSVEPSGVKVKLEERAHKSVQTKVIPISGDVQP